MQRMRKGKLKGSVDHRGCGKVRGRKEAQRVGGNRRRGRESSLRDHNYNFYRDSDVK